MYSGQMKHLLARSCIADLVPLLIPRALEHTAAGSGTGYLTAIFEDVQARGHQAQGLEGVGRIEDEETGGFALFNAITILNTQSARRIGRNKVQHILNFVVA